MNEKREQIWTTEAQRKFIAEATARIASLEAENAKLIAALNATIHEIKMQTWTKFNGEGSFETVAEKNPAIMTARAAIRKATEK